MWAVLLGWLAQDPDMKPIAPKFVPLPTTDVEPFVKLTEEPLPQELPAEYITSQDPLADSVAFHKLVMALLSAVLQAERIALFGS